jgi:hypothetical protein
MGGFIGIDRGLRDHWIYQDAEYLKVWLEMLFLARFSEETHTELIDGDLISVEYGQFIFGRVKWSQRLKISEQRLRTLMAKLKKENMIELVLEHRKCSVYALVNYAKFNHESNHQKTQSQQWFEDDANHQSNQLPTISQPSANHQPTTKEQCSNKVNKDNKEKRDYIFLEDMPHVRITKNEFEKLTALIGSEDKVMTKLYSFAEWILKQPKKKQETASAYLSITKWCRLDKEKEKPQTGGEQVEWTGAGDGGNVVPIAQGKPKSLTEQFARRAQP